MAVPKVPGHQDESAALALAIAAGLTGHGMGCVNAGGPFPLDFDRMMQLDKTTLLQQY